MAPSTAPGGDHPPWVPRAGAMLRVAASQGVGVPLGDLVVGLPDDGPSSAEEASRSLTTYFPGSVVRDGVAYLGEAISHDVDARRERAERAAEWVTLAEQLLRDGLGRAGSWIRCAAVTGSTAFGGSVAGDDCDLFVVVERGTVWPFLFWTYARLRWRLDRARFGSVRWCFNYVAEEPRAVREFAGARGFQFAREALAARVVRGEPGYARLLGAAPWMAGEVPRLYRARVPGRPDRVEPPPRRAPWIVRAMNVPLFLLLGTYVHAAGVVRNWRLRRTGRGKKVFRTNADLTRLAYASEEFVVLGQVYEGAELPPGFGPVSSGGPS